MDVRLVTSVPEPEAIRAATRVYREAFAQSPYHEPDDAAAAFAERIGRYARERDGFRLVTATADDGQMIGVAMAVIAQPGDWWRDRVASVIPEPAASRWFGEACLEVVHVAVAPGAQGKGTGRLVHDVLIAGRPAPTAVLSVHPDAMPARRLYAGRGWTVLSKALPTAGPDYWLMAREL